MGDRALIQLTTGKAEAGVAVNSPVLYLHWAGDEVADILNRTKARMESRGPDLDYTFARLVQEAIADDNGNLSFGVSNRTYPLHASSSHGDAGCFLVDIGELGWLVRCGGGYGLLGEHGFRTEALA